MRNYYTSLAFTVFLTFAFGMKVWAMHDASKPFFPITFHLLTLTDTLTPIANDDTVSTIENQAVRFVVSANDTMYGTFGALGIADTVKHGTIGFIAVDTLIYNPRPGFCGKDTFSYYLCNTELRCDTARVIISVGCVDTIIQQKLFPVAVNDYIITDENKSLVFTPLSNDTIKTSLLSLSVAGDSTKRGTIAFIGLDSILYKPNPGFCGFDSLRYSICQPDFTCDTAWVFITVRCDTTANALISIALDDSVTIRANQQVLIDVMANDIQRGTSNWLNTISVQKGTTWVESNQVRYIPPTDFCGKNDTLKYALCNEFGCDTAMVVVKILCDTVKPNLKPIATDDNFTMDTEIGEAILLVTQNDTLFGKTPQLLSVVKAPQHGFISFNKNSVEHIYYNPPKDCPVVDTFEYAICTTEGCDTAKVTITVLCRPIEKRPVALPDTAYVAYGKEIMVDVLLNDTLNNADTFRIIKNPLRGLAQFTTLGQIYFRSDSMTCGLDSLTYQICNKGGCATTYLLLRVGCPAPNATPPSVTDDKVTTMINRPVIIKVFGNDIRRQAEKAEVTLVPKHGSVTPIPFTYNDFIYLPNLDMWGRDSFQYRACNDYGCDTAWVRIYINAGDSIVVYSGFSPNGDDINDRFLIRGIDAHPNNEVVIYNRFGNEVFHQKNYTNEKAWDGVWNGNILPVGTYFYVITIKETIYRRITGYIQIHR